MAPILYQDLMSPPNQAVALTVRAAGLESAVESRNISLAKGDHMDPEFVKKFPMHAVPALEDGDLYLADSHAICAYLVSAYAKDDALYPKDPKKRAKVDQYLHFSNSILYNRLRDMSEPLWMRKATSVPEEKKERVGAALQTLEELLGERDWLCGDRLTLADICCVCESLGCSVLYGDTSKFKILTAWQARCRAALPGFKELVDEGVEKYGAALKFLLASSA